MEILFELTSEKTFDQAVEGIKEALKPYGFGVLWELDFKDKLAEKGLDFEGNFKVMEVCNPSKAIGVLTTDITAGYFLPCKVVVYIKEGQVTIGMLKPTSLIEIYGNKDLASVAESVEYDLIAAITEAV